MTKETMRKMEEVAKRFIKKIEPILRNKQTPPSLIPKDPLIKQTKIGIKSSIINPKVSKIMSVSKYGDPQATFTTAGQTTITLPTVAPKNDNNDNNNQNTTPTLNNNININNNNINNNNNNNNFNKDNPTPTHTTTNTLTTVAKKDDDSWTSKTDFIMSCIGFAVGLGNLWRFPYLCYKNGGGAFLIPYMLTLIFAGIPVAFLEHSLGQLIGQGVLGVWELCPALKGVGYATIILLFLENVYYMQLLAWSSFYFFKSFNTDLPWASCNNSWNTKDCYRSAEGKGCASIDMTRPENAKWVNCTNPVSEYWFRYVLRRSATMSDFSDYNLQVAVLLALCWVWCLYVIYGGLKGSGKVIYFTALFPYFCLIVLFFRGITLPGSWNGVKHFFYPKFEQLIDPNVWNDASTQVFFSYGICVGCWIALASRNKFNYNLQYHCIAICSLNCATAIFAGVTVFSVIGFLAHDEGKPIDTVVESGVGLAFIVYPEAALRLPLSPFWSALFFAMLITLGMGSMFVMAEAFNKAVIDEFEVIRTHQIIYGIVVFTVVTVSGNLFCFSSGVYWFEIFNFYSSSGFAMLFLVFCEMITIFWIYGSERYIDQIESMMGFKINCIWYYCWKYASPALTAGIFILSIVIYKPLGYQNFVFPTWGIYVGLFLASLSMCAIPIYSVFRYCITDGTDMYDKLQKVFAPNPKVEELIQARRDHFLEEQEREKSLKLRWKRKLNIAKTEKLKN